MRIFLQQKPAANELPRYFQLSLQQDLLGGWTLVRESGQIGGKSAPAVARAIEAHSDEIVRANADDCARSEKENLAAPLLKRLKFDNAKIRDTVDGIESLVKLPDPVGRTLLSTELDKGLDLSADDFLIL